MWARIGLQIHMRWIQFCLDLQKCVIEYPPEDTSRLCTTPFLPVLFHNYDETGRMIILSSWQNKLFGGLMLVKAKKGRCQHLIHEFKQVWKFFKYHVTFMFYQGKKYFMLKADDSMYQNWQNVIGNFTIMWSIYGVFST